MVQAGLPPIDAIRAATVWAATHVGLDKEVGSIVPGKAADIVAVKADPLTDIRALETVAFVMKGGDVVRAVGD
jgi:imidazolonepropionase-like amidohydrolase